MKSVRFVIALVILLLVAACEGAQVEKYCGTDAEYLLTKTGKTYQLDLWVGQAFMRQCDGWAKKERARNLHIQVSSPEEAHKIIERELKIYEEAMKSRASLTTANQK